MSFVLNFLWFWVLFTTLKPSSNLISLCVLVLAVPLAGGFSLFSGFVSCGLHGQQFFCPLIDMYLYLSLSCTKMFSLWQNREHKDKTSILSVYDICTNEIQEHFTQPISKVYDPKRNNVLRSRKVSFFPRNFPHFMSLIFNCVCAVALAYVIRMKWNFCGFPVLLIRSRDMPLLSFFLPEFYS